MKCSGRARVPVGHLLQRDSRGSEAGNRMEPPRIGECPIATKPRRSPAARALNRDWDERTEMCTSVVVAATLVLWPTVTCLPEPSSSRPVDRQIDQAVHSVDLPNAGNPGRQCVALGTNPDRLPGNNATLRLGISAMCMCGRVGCTRVGSTAISITELDMRPECRIADNSLSKTKNPDLHRHADRGLNSSVGAEGFEPRPLVCKTRALPLSYTPELPVRPSPGVL